MGIFKTTFSISNLQMVSALSAFTSIDNDGTDGFEVCISVHTRAHMHIHVIRFCFGGDGDD